MEFIRIWTEKDIKEIQEHMLIVDDKFGFCPSCKQMGIALADLKQCPQCGREFKYMTSREKGNRGFNIVKWALKKLPHLTFVDAEDYDNLTGKKKAADLFNV